MLILSRDFANSAAEQEYRGSLPGNQYYRNDVIPEATTPDFSETITSHSERMQTADQVYLGHSRVWLIVSEKSACLCLQCEDSIGAKITPEKQAWSSLSDHAHLC